MSAALLAPATRWLMLAVIAGGLAWLVFGVLLPHARRRAENDATEAED
jgi:zinc transporter ZupT